MDMKNMNDMTNKNDMIQQENMDKFEDMDREELDEPDDMDRLLQAAFAKMVETEYEKRPKKFPKHRFSRKFRRNMEELLRTGRAPAEDRREPSGVFSLLELMRPLRSRKAVLIVAVLMLLLFGMTAGSMNPIIVWMHDSWMEQHGDYVELQNRGKGDNVSQKSFCKYELAEVPKGYEVVEAEFDKSVGIYFMTYADKDGNLFVFNQGKKENGNLGNITANRKDMEEVSVGDLKGFYIDEAESSSLVLSDEEYMLVFSGDLSKEEFIEIASGLRAVE